MLVELIPEEKRRLYELEQNLHQIINENSSSSSDFSMSLDEVDLRLKEIEKLVQKESKQKKPEYMSRYNNLKSIYNNIKEEYTNFILRQSKNDPVVQRMQLFNNFNSINTSSTINNTNSSGTDRDAYFLEMAENGALSRSSRLLAGYIEQSELSLQELLNQKDRLKSVRKKTLDILNYLGMSKSILSKVERRDYIDGIIVLVGCIFILCLMFFVYYFIRK